MPEGPSIVILKEQISQLHLEGQPVLAVEGNTSIEKERLIHQEVREFRSWGKHFLICFNDFTLRVHFMLFGTYRINQRKESQVRLSLRFETAEINFYACSLQFIEGDIHTIYNWSEDVMSEEWNEKAALNKLKTIPETLVCDALLNQDIFAGVGNIIKNEVLYRIKIHPLSKVGALPNKKLKSLLKKQ